MKSTEEELLWPTAAHPRPRPRSWIVNRESWIVDCRSVEDQEDRHSPKIHRSSITYYVVWKQSRNGGIGLFDL